MRQNLGHETFTQHVGSLKGEIAASNTPISTEKFFMPRREDVSSEDQALLVLRVSGRKVAPGMLPVDQLIAMLRDTTQAVKRAASIELYGESSLTNYTREVEEACDLIAGTASGSALVVLRERVRQEVVVEGELPLARRATARIIRGIRHADTAPKKAVEDFDPGLVASIVSLSQRIPTGERLEIYSPVLRAAGRATVTASVVNRLKGLDVQPTTAYREVIGKIHRISESPDRFAFTTPEGAKINAQWDERHRRVIGAQLVEKKWVRARGIAKFRPKKELPYAIVIDELELADEGSGPGVAIPDRTPKKALLKLMGAWEGFEPDKSSVELVRKFREEAEE